MKCHELGGTQEWKMREDKNNITAIYNMAAGLCLVPNSQKTGGHIKMDVCSEESHVWSLIHIEQLQENKSSRDL